MSADPLPPALRPVRALVFDLIGTTTDWFTPVHTALVAHAPTASAPPSTDWEAFAHAWRKGFFRVVKEASQGGTFIGLDEVYGKVLDELCEAEGIKGWGEDVKKDLIKSWWNLQAWGDTAGGMEALRRKYIVAGLSNGSAPFLIQANKRSGVNYDIILPSNLIGAYKPDPKMYTTAIKTLELEPQECAMVAAHAYDLDAAATHGMRTIYIARHTEDIGAHIQDNKYDLVVREGGIAELARRLAAV